jgi:hypothetical protein
VGSIVNSQRNNIPVSANAVVPGKYSAIGLNPVGPEVTCAIVEPMLTVPVEKPSSPDEISKYESSRTEIDHNVNGKGGNLLFNFSCTTATYFLLKNHLAVYCEDTCYL